MGASCTALEACCETLPSGEQDACTHVVGLKNEGSCASLETTYMNSSQCNGSGVVGADSYVCDYTSMDVCLKSFAPANYLAMYKSACVSAGGTTPDACPTDGLIGCCSLGTTSESCYYGDPTGKPTAADCAQTTGTWSTTP